MKRFILLAVLFLAAVGCGVETSSLFPTYTPESVYVSFTETPESSTAVPIPTSTEQVDFCVEVVYTVACVTSRCAVRYEPRMEENSVAYFVPQTTQFHVDMECNYPENPVPRWYFLGEDNGNSFWIAGVDTVWTIQP